MNKQLYRRESIINQTVRTIKQAMEEEKEINEKDFVIEIMIKTSVTKRTAQEYFEVAMAKVERLPQAEATQ